MIYSIVVLYNPDDFIEERLQILSNESDFLFVIINQLETFDCLKNKISNSEFICLGKNHGLAKALNIGLRKCLEDDRCKYIALFDQDSIPKSGMLEILRRSIETSAVKVAAAGSVISDLKNRNSTIQFNDLVNEVNVIITSGSLIPISSIKEIGLMDETLFIDYIDYEWCLRAKSKGYKILQVNDALLYHNMGDTFVTVFGKSKPLHKNKLRHYYIIRNQLIMLDRNYVPCKWKCIHFLKLFYRIPGYIFLSDDKKQTAKIIVNAVRDFLTNRKEYNSIKY